ncbi:hypothetical protein ACE41F_26870 [Bacillus cereus]|uniref:hypothetical protein n=1 Tax=Bacillus cereus TaxID=1396 RepID=UPI0035CBE872
MLDVQTLIALSEHGTTVFAVAVAYFFVKDLSVSVKRKKGENYIEINISFKREK